MHRPIRITLWVIQMLLTYGGLVLEVGAHLSINVLNNVGWYKWVMHVKLSGNKPNISWEGAGRREKHQRGF